MENKKIETLPKVKIATIIAYTALVLSLLFLIINSPVTGYELSIYSSIPLFWAFIFIAISIAVTLLVHQVYKKTYEDFWCCFFILLLSFIIIFTLPVSRGYYLYGSNDLTTHYGYIMQIVSSGNFGNNYYPISHILGAELLLFCSQIPLQTILEIIPPIFSIIFISFIYYLANVVFKKQDYAIMAATLGFIPLYSYYHIILYPHSIAIMLLPLIFYLYFSSKVSANFKIIFIISLVIEAFVHVIPALIIFGCLMSAEIFKIIINRFNTSSKYYISFNSAITSIVVFFAWWSSYSIFNKVNKAYDWMVGQTEEIIPRTYEVQNVASQGQQVFIDLFLKMYGNQFILTILTLITIAVMLFYYLKRKEDLRNPLILSVILLTSAFTYILYFFTSGFATIGRFFGANYGVWAMPVITAFLFTKLSREKIRFLITVIIISLLIFSSLNIYRSEWVYQPNWQITKQDIIAKNWLDTNKSNKLMSGIISSPWGVVPDQAYMRATWAYVPPHFGYDMNMQLGDFVYEDSIIYYGETRQKLVNKNEIFNKSKINDVWGLSGFSDEDYVKLQNDNTVNFLYSNGEIKIIFVKKIGETGSVIN